MSGVSERIARLSSAKRALLALETRERDRAAAGEAIAVIGMGCRYPGGVRDGRSFWELLSGGVDAIVEVPRERWDVETYYDADPEAPGKMNTKWGGFVDGVDEFDAAFFGISPREAARMDPQQRLLLEVSWEALEDAGQALDRLAGVAGGVYVGISTSDYSQLQLKWGDERELDGYFGTGNALSVASGRLSYVLGWQGPSVSVDTACSSSLVAVHLACQGLRAGECRVALAGGVNVMLSPEITVNFTKARMMAADGRCKTFDASADGYVRGEGCGVVVLKRWSDALKDGDRVLGLIRGSAVNQDGRSGGLTVPHGPSQEAVIREALRRASVEPREVGYVEAHGTGTSLGDPIEVRALASVLGEGRVAGEGLWLGSVKTNVGHLEAAAGMAGLMKVLLCLEHEEIAPHLHLKELNPHIQAEGLEFSIPRAGVEWRRGVRRRVAGVSSFGFSGTNAHVVVEEAPQAAQAGGEPGVTERPRQVLCLSAKSDVALEELARRYAAHLRGGGSWVLGDVCFTAHVGRAHFGRRLFVEGETAEDLARGLEALSTGAEVEAGVHAGRGVASEGVRVAFVFPDLGEAHAGLGLEPYRTQKRFREAWQRCEEAWGSRGGRSLLSLAEGGAGEGGVGAAAALFALEYALSELWRAWGVEASAVFGVGVGEYVAACVSGALSLEGALGLLSVRAELVRERARAGTGVEALQRRLREAAQGVESRVPVLSWVSSVTGGEVSAAPSVEHWSAELEASGGGAAAGLAVLASQGIETYLEPGPRSWSRGEPRPGGERELWLASMDGPGTEWATLLASLGQLYVRGVSIDWPGFERDYTRRRVALPTYPFQRQRAWLEFDPQKRQASASASRCFRSASGDVFWETRLEGELPAAALLDWVQVAAAEALGAGTWFLDDLEFRRPTSATPADCAALQVAFHPMAGGEATFQAFTGPGPDGSAAPWSLELTGTLRGHSRAPDVVSSARQRQPMQFGLMFFSGAEESWGPEKYRLVIEAARFADSHGFSSVWVPERHFVKLGSLYPNPAVLHAALARETRRIRLRAGSVVMPLHDPVRVAEEWAMVDNLSGGRVDVSFASGWHPGDFIFFPDRYADRHEEMFRGIETFRSLWRGEPVIRQGGDGGAVQVRIFPTPLQKDLPVWITAAGNPRTFERAGAMGAHLLTHLLDQDVEALAEKLTLYREARRRAGHDPEAGRVTVMLHAFLGEDVDAVREEVRGPFTNYLRSIAPLLEGLGRSRNRSVDLDALPEQEQDALVHFLFERFFATRALLGTPQSCRELIGQLQTAGVDEVACLLDFGPPSDRVLANLPQLDRLRLQTLAEHAPVARAATPAAPALVPDGLRDCFYELRWEERALARRVPDSPPGLWLLVGHGGDVAHELARALSERGQECLRITGDAAEVVAHVRHALAGTRPCRGIVDLRALDGEGRAAGLAEAAAAGAWAALEVVQALLLADQPLLPRVWWVTRAAQPVPRPEPSAALEQAALWGLGRSCAMEHPELWGGLVDLGPDASAPQSAAHVLEALASVEDQVAWRGARSYVARFVRVPAPPPHAPVLAEDGAYLVTGGLWGLGLDVARMLARRGARHLVLLGRTPLPPRDEWANLEPGSRAQRQTAALAELERRGVDVAYVVADVGDEAHLRSVLEDLRRGGFPALRGVVHAASVWQDAQGRPLVGPVARLTPASFRQVFRPKVAGAWALHRALEGTALDFFICFSSAAALMGSAGQGNYAAANAFMDALAAHRRALGQAGLSINWGAVSESGFGATQEGLRVHEYWEARGIRRLTPSEVVDAVERLLSASRASLGVLRLEWSLLHRSYPRLVERPWVSAFLDEARPRAGTGAEREDVLRRVREAAPAQRAQILRAHLVAQVAAVLALPAETLDVEAPLTAVGLDSLAAVELRNRIERELQVAVPVVKFLEEPSLAALLDYVLERLAETPSATLPAHVSGGFEQGEL